MMVILEKKLQEELADFGKKVAIDGKMIQSYANKVSIKEPDGRRETQADRQLKLIIQITELKLLSIILVSESIY
ncbi:hypothetical protein [Granulicatella elegans]|uniref:hypothetical protein n=1 Tax=Granulicatella elegans TaxID=137732 RepID=UPI001D155ABE|nr:hypothetical protein [Granulicatella elegans]UEA30819.1 hypothetical protein LK443_05920 [Granulicatella elegans]